MVVGKRQRGGVAVNQH